MKKVLLPLLFTLSLLSFADEISDIYSIAGTGIYFNEITIDDDTSIKVTELLFSQGMLNFKESSPIGFGFIMNLESLLDSELTLRDEKYTRPDAIFLGLSTAIGGYYRYEVNEFTLMMGVSYVYDLTSIMYSELITAVMESHGIMLSPMVIYKMSDRLSLMGGIHFKQWLNRKATTYGYIEEQGSFTENDFSWFIGVVSKQKYNKY